MGLFDKLKNVLFEEEEVEIPIISKKENKEPQEIKKVVNNEEKINPFLEDEDVLNEDFKSNLPKEDISKFRNVKRDIDFGYSEDEDFEVPNLKKEEPKEEKVSPFLSFDEDEFERLNKKVKSNEKERSNRLEGIKKENKNNPSKQVSENVVPQGFRPSPIISPVYGILDKNYKKEDISVKSENRNNTNTSNSLDIDSVRKKAYGTLEDDIESALTFDSEEEINEPVTLEDKSVDEMLKESIDDTIVIDDELEDEMPIIKEEEKKLPTFEEILEEKTNDTLYDEYDEEIENKTLEEQENPNDILEKTNTLKILDDIEKELDDVKSSKDHLEDTTETDLFNLIDSMYEESEGEN